MHIWDSWNKVGGQLMIKMDLQDRGDVPTMSSSISECWLSVTVSGINPPCSGFYESLAVYLIRANLPPTFRPIVRFA